MIVQMVRRTCFNHELLPGHRADPDDLMAWGAMRCQDCSGLSRLLRRNHYVDVFGYVSPSCVCPLCGATRDLLLLDWVPEAKGDS